MKICNVWELVELWFHQPIKTFALERETVPLLVVPVILDTMEPTVKIQFVMEFLQAMPMFAVDMVLVLPLINVLVKTIPTDIMEVLHATVVPMDGPVLSVQLPSAILH